MYIAIFMPNVRSRLAAGSMSPLVKCSKYRVKAPFLFEQFGCLGGLPLCGAAALQRALRQVIDTMQRPVAFIKAATMRKQLV